MINAEEAVVWINLDTKEVMVRSHNWGRPEQHREFKDAVPGLIRSAQLIQNGGKGLMSSACD
jgi:hypothetical protein